MKWVERLVITILVILTLGLLLANVNVLVQAAYDASDPFVKQQSDSLTVTAEVKDNRMPVFNNYQKQETYNPQQVGLNK
jgi:uncharacterized protein YxeA